MKILIEEYGDILFLLAYSLSLISTFKMILEIL